MSEFEGGIRMKQGIIPILFCILPFFLGSCYDGTESGSVVPGDNTGNNTNQSSVKLQVESTPPSQVLTNSSAISSFWLTNVSRSSQSLSSQEIVVTDFSKELSGSGDVDVDLSFDKNDKVGPGGVCWKDGEGAKLGPGDRCEQIVSFTSSKADSSIQGTLTVHTNLGSDYDKAVEINTNFKSSDNFHSDNKLEIARPLELAPYTTENLIVNNVTPANLGDAGANGVYLDLSWNGGKIKDLIDMGTLSGGVYDEKKNRILVPDVPSGENRKISFFVKGNAQDTLKDKNVQSSLSDNVNNPAISVGAANVKNTIAPEIVVKTDPLEEQQPDPDGDINVIVPSKTKAITFVGLTSIQPANASIEVTPYPDSGAVIEPGGNVVFHINRLEKGSAGTYYFDANFGYGANETSFSKRFYINVNNSVTLENLNTALTVLNTGTASDNSHEPFYIRNTSTKFMAHFTKDSGPDTIVEELVNPSSTGIDIKPYLDPSITQHDDCGSDTIKGDGGLLPGKTCRMLASVSDVAITPGSYGLYSKNLNNIKASSLNSVSVQKSLVVPTVVMRNMPPAKFGDEGRPYTTMELSDPSSTATTMTELAFENMADWDCTPASLATSDPPSTIPTDSKSPLKISCTVKDGVKKDIHGGIIKATFSNGKTYSSGELRSQYASASALPQALQVKPITIQPDNAFPILISNSSDHSRLQKVRIHFGGLSADFKAENFLVPEEEDELNIEGLAKDSSTGDVILVNDMLPGTQKTVDFAWPLGMAETLESNQSELEGNGASSPVITISGIGSQPVYPAITVFNHILSYEKTSIDIDGPQTRTLAFVNNTGSSVALSIDSSRLPQGLSASVTPDTVDPGNSGIVMITSHDNILPGVHIIPVAVRENVSAKVMAQDHGSSFAEESEPFHDKLTVRVSGVSLSFITASKAYLPELTHKSTAMMVLANINESGHGYTLEGIDKVSSAFRVENANGETISSDTISLEKFDDKPDITEKVEYGGQVTVGITVHDSNLPVGWYKLVTQQAGNLMPDKVAGYFEVRQHSSDLEVVEQSHIPDKVLAEETSVYVAQVKNTGSENITVTGVKAPEGTIFAKDGDFGESPVWDGEKGSELLPGNSANFRLSFKLNSGDTYTGDLVFIYTKGTDANQHEYTATHFDSSVTPETIQPEIFAENQLVFIPGGTASLKTIAFDHGLNQPQLLLGNMPDDLFQEISGITINGQRQSLKSSDGTMNKNFDIDPVLPGQSFEMTLGFKSTAESVLNKYKAELEDNKANQYIILQAANLSAQHPLLRVVTAPLEAPSSDEILLASTDSHQINFVNHSEVSLILKTMDDTSLPAEVKAEEGSCVKDRVLKPDEGCFVNLTATKEAKPVTDTFLKMNYSVLNTDLSTKVPVNVDRTTLRLTLPSNLLRRPEATDTEHVSYNVSLTNTGPFTMTVQNGNLFGLLSASDTHSQGAPRLESVNCKVTELEPGAGCQVRLNVFLDDINDGPHTISMETADTNLKPVSEVAYEYVYRDGSFGIFNRSGEVVAAGRMVGEGPVKMDFVVQNVGDNEMKLSDTVASFSYDDPGDSSPKPAVDFSKCLDGGSGKTLASGEYCHVLIQGPNFAHSTATHPGTLRFSLINDQQATEEYAMPLDVEPAVDWSQVSAGAHHTCAIRKDNNKLYCWGLNSSGQLGTGNTLNTEVPVLVEGLSDVINVSAGAYHTCAITSDKKLHCWGKNSNGELGTGTRDNYSIPKQIESSMNFSSVSAGSDHTCAVRDNKTLYCWGKNDNGQLGTGTKGDPFPEPQHVASLSNVSQVTAMHSHTCAITDDDKLYCWGFNFRGQLGVGDKNDRKSPTELSFFSTPGATQVVGGLSYSCAIRKDNEQPYCWGENESGQLGIGSASNTDQVNPQPVVSPLDVAVSQVAARNIGTFAIRKSDKKLFYWGAPFGQGLNATPTKVNSTASFVQVTAGHNHTCALADDNKLYCLGTSSNGAHGLGIYSTDEPLVINNPAP